MAAAFALPRAALSVQRDAVRPLALSSVRLAPSPWLQAVEANRAYLHRLEPDRLLRGYRVAAGLNGKEVAQTDSGENAPPWSVLNFRVYAVGK